MPPRHSRPAALATPYLVALLAVVVGATVVGLLADERLALQLALAGVLFATIMLWIVYGAALREARADLTHELALHRRTTRVVEAVTAERDRGRVRHTSTESALREQLGAARAALRGTTAQAERAEAELASLRAPQPESSPASTDADLWEVSDAPTVVTLADRREDRDPPASRARHA